MSFNEKINGYTRGGNQTTIRSYHNIIRGNDFKKIPDPFATALEGRS